MIGLTLNEHEKALADRLGRLKAEAGSHSPSIQTLRKSLPELEIKVDACFLSNPYATDLFMKHLHDEVIGTGRLRDLLEFYPSQNRVVAANLVGTTGVPAGNLIIGNGAIELIQALMHRFVRGKVLLPIPTFSSYYEFATKGTEVVYHRLRKEEGYALDVDRFADEALAVGAAAAIVISPSNPTGHYVPVSDLRRLLDRLRSLELVVVDESFIHFAHEGPALELIDLYPLIESYPNLVLVKSMSKDFGVAGLRAGYAVMSRDRVDVLLSNGHLWNSNGIAEYFFSLYARPSFQADYDELRRRYIAETMGFEAEMKALPGIVVHPTQANFLLVELPEARSPEAVVSALLIRHGIYLRNCDDKIGLQGRYVRVASRGIDDNAKIVAAFRSVLT